RAVAAFWLGQDKTALADLDALAEGAAAFATTYGYRAVLRSRAGRATEARADLARFLRGSDSPAEQAATKALVAVYLGEEQRGLKELETELSNHPKDAGWLRGAARVYARAAEVARLRQAAARVAGLVGQPTLPSSFSLVSASGFQT